MTIDLTKPVRDKSGRHVEILRTNLKNPTYPVVAIRTDTSGAEAPQLYKADGRFFDHRLDDESDLINVPEPKYKMVYADGYVVPQAKWLASKEAFDRECFEAVGRVGYLVKTDGVYTFEPI